MQNTEEIIVKCAIDAKLLQLGSTNPKKKASPWFFCFLIFTFFTIYNKKKMYTFFIQKCSNLHGAYCPREHLSGGFIYRGLIIGGFCPGGFCSGAFYRGGFDLDSWVAKLPTKKVLFFQNLKIFEFVLIPECITKLKYKTDHISKNENRNKKTHRLKNPFQNIAHLFRLFSRVYKCFPIFE